MKKCWEQYLLNMIRPLETRFTEDKARLPLGGFAAGYGMKTAEMEGALRLLWGLTPYWAGGGTEAESFKDIYLECVKNGTNPESPSYWGDIKDRDQKIVELAALSCNLLMTPDVIWNRLTFDEQEQLASWLYQVNDAVVPDNNWHFFVVLVNLALKKCGKPYSQPRIQQGIQRYEAFYLGNGWYSDGQRPQKDYYVSFGIHFYCLLYAYFCKDEDPERCQMYVERAVVFEKTFRYWFDSQGRALAYGRSQTYRFAQAAFLSILVLVLKEQCPERGEIKWILRRHMDHWMSQPIFDNGGVLIVGYQYPNLLMSEGYNSPGSPYWGFKTFICLALPDDDPFWAVEEKEPVWEPVITIPECDMVITHETGHGLALTAGQYPVVEQTHSPEKYAKFAYSTVFGFSVPRSAGHIHEAAPDNMLAFEVHGAWYVRKRCISFEVTDGRVKCSWSPVDGILVETELVPAEHGYMAKHRIETEIEMPRTQAAYAGTGDKNGYSRIFMKVIRDGVLQEAEGQVIKAAPNTNLIYPLTRIPVVRAQLQPGTYEVDARIEGYMKPGKIVIGKGDCYELQ